MREGCILKAARLEPRANLKKKYGCRAFFITMLMAAIMFLPFIIYDNGLFLYYGDFNVQQIPFYQMIHDSILQGNIGWSHTTDLGANIIGSYTFYNLGSPFFWITLLFPSQAVPYLMAPLLILKMSFASLGAYIFTRRYVRNKDLAVIAGILYAFSGFSIYNIFFNHFHEAILIFPFLLAAIDEYMINARKGVVALAVFAACLFNYYFFVGQVVFVVIYWFLRVLTGGYKLTLRSFIRLAIEVLIGFCATAVLLLPTVLAVMQNPRVSNAPDGWSALIYNPAQRYMHIFTSLFFPPDIPARPNFTPDSNSKWASIAAWVPLFGMTGMIAFLQTKSYKNWIKKLLVLLIVFAFVPILNSAFQAFNSTYYARWFYMLTLIMCLATVSALDSAQVNWKRALAWTTVITIGVAVAIGFMPQTRTDSETKEETVEYGLFAYSDRFWAYVAIALISIAVLFVLFRLWKKNRRRFIRACYLSVGIICVAYSMYLIGLGKSHGYDTHNYLIPNVINKQEQMSMADEDNMRSDFYECMDNVAMFYQIPTIQAFHSIVPGSVMEFYPAVGVTRDVGSRPDTSTYGLRSFLSVKYLFDYAEDSESFEQADGETEMPGYEYIGMKNGYAVYENENFIPMGYTFDSFISEEDFYDITTSSRHLALLKAMVLTEEQLEKYSDIVSDSLTDSRGFRYTASQCTNDCAERNELTCTEFEYTNSGFNATADLTEHQSDTLMFFSVPYESGWSATVNGESVDVEKVSVGFMAVRVNGGEVNEIVFTYETPGLKAGLVISVLSAAAFIVYMILSRKHKPKANGSRAVFLVKSRQKRLVRNQSVVMRKPGLSPHNDDSGADFTPKYDEIDISKNAN